MASWLNRLGRQKLFRWIVAYLTGAWLALEVFTLLREGFGWPDWTFRVAVAVVLAGLGGVIASAWYRSEREHRSLAAAGLVLGVTLLVGAYLILPRAGTGPPDHQLAPGRTVVDPTRVALLPLENRTGDETLDAVGPSIADWIAETLHGTGLVQVADAFSAQAAVRLLRDGGFAGNPLEQLGLETGAAFIVDGSFTQRGDLLEFLVRVSDSREQVLLEALNPLAVPRHAPLSGAGRLGAQIMTALAERLNPTIADFEQRIGEPPSYEAYQSYIVGIDTYLDGRIGEAHDAFGRAYEADTTFLRAAKWHAFSSSYGNPAGPTFRSRYMDALFERLDARYDRFTVADRHHIEFFRHFFRGDLPEAYRAARARAAAVPGSVDARREVALSAMRIGLHREAHERLTSLDPGRGLLRSWDEYWPTLASVYWMLGRPDSASAALDRAPPVVLGDAVEVQSWVVDRLWVLAALGRSPELMEWVLAQEVAEVAPYLPVAASALLGVGERMRAEALRDFAENPAPADASPDDGSQAEPLAMLRYLVGDLSGAEVLLNRIEPSARSADLLGIQLAVELLRDQGSIDDIDASASATRLESISLDHGNWWEARQATLWLANAALLGGDREGAMARIRAAEPRWVGLGHPPLYMDPRFAPLRGWEPFDSLLEEQVTALARRDP